VGWREKVVSLEKERERMKIEIVSLKEELGLK
jgi:hypothetical protein